MKAHPRSRGENRWALAWNVPVTGSSPLTRGKRRCSLSVSFVEGLIPAHAGKTRSAVLSPAFAPAHPRSRGENIAADGQALRRAGSSPLTRGKLSCARLRCSLGGLIPAHTGKTTPSFSGRGRGPAHPRSRGENISVAGTLALVAGSSPLTRGKPPPGGTRSYSPRLIPAHAGKTNEFKALSMLVSAHPRSRGENLASLL